MPAHRVPSIKARLFGLVVAGLLLDAGHAGATTLEARVASQPRVLFDSTATICDRRIFPDAPARAVRDAAGVVRLFAADERNWSLEGRNLAALTVRCAPALQGRRARDPDAFDDRSWIAALHTRDGVEVRAIVHNEFHGHERPSLCPSRAYEPCWENALVEAVSRDGGKTFQRDEKSRQVVAALPAPYRGDRPRQVGYFNPTNLVEKDGYVYAMAGYIPEDGRAGPCLIRAPRDWNAASWRAWDGQSFSIDLGGRAAGRSGSCSPIMSDNLFFGVGSISVHRGSGLFVATMRFNRWDRKRRDEVPGIYVTASRDLVTWTTPVLLMADSDVAPAEDPRQIEYYPALVDETAGDRNFATIGDTPTLITTQMSRSRQPWQRRLVARDVIISVHP